MNRSRSFPLTLSLSKGEVIGIRLLLICGISRVMAFYVYILRCADGRYYVGHTDDLDRRMAEHGNGVASAFTAKRRPLTLIWASDCPSRDVAFDLERKLKGWSRAKKEAFMRGDYDALPALSRNRQEQHPSTGSG